MLLSVFALSITPKRALHNFAANHTDNSKKPGDGKTTQLSKAGFNCRCDDLVAETNFIPGAILIIAAPVALHRAVASFYSSFLSFSHIWFNLRGPPVSF